MVSFVFNESLSWNASGFFCLYSFIFTLLNNYLPEGEPMCTLCICHYSRNQFLAGLHRLCPQAGHIRSARVVSSLHPLPLTFILLLLLLTASCRGRCGGEYYRGYRCQCDYNCLSYGECCNDYESQCTTSEAFSFFGSVASSRIEIFGHHC